MIDIKPLLERAQQVIENESKILFDSYADRAGEIKDEDVVEELSALTDTIFELEQVGVAFDQLRAAKENAVLQAQIWAQEARTQQAIVAEIYKAIGFEGGDWNGARPVIEKLAELGHKPDYPECSGDPDNCPENEGHGCCNRVEPTVDEALDAAGFNPFKPLCEPLQENEEQ